MTEKQQKALIYAGFTDAQIVAMGSVFNVLPPPERRKEIDGFVKRTAEKMREIDETGIFTEIPQQLKPLSARITDLRNELNAEPPTPEPDTPEARLSRRIEAMLRELPPGGRFAVEVSGDPECPDISIHKI